MNFSSDGSQSLFFHNTSMKSDLLRSASAIIPFPARWRQVSPAGLVVDFNPFKETSSMRVCPSVGSSVFVCAPAAEPSWHSSNKTERLLWNLHQRCQFTFLFKHLNKLRIFFKRRESYWCKDCSAFYSFCSFVIFTNVFFFFCL